MLVLIYSTLHLLGLPATSTLCGEFVGGSGAAHIPSLIEAQGATACSTCATFLDRLTRENL